MSKIVTAVITAELPPGVTSEGFRENIAVNAGALYDGIAVRTLKDNSRVTALIAACEGLLCVIHNGGGSTEALNVAHFAIVNIKRAP